MEPPDLGGRDPRDDPVDRHEPELDDDEARDQYDDVDYASDDDESAGYYYDDERDGYYDAESDGYYDDAESSGYYLEGDGQASDHDGDDVEFVGYADDERYDEEPVTGVDPDHEYADEPDADDYHYADDDQDEVAAGYVDDDGDRRRAGFLTPFLLGALLGALVLGMVWGAVSVTGSGESRADPAQNRDAQAAASHSDRVAQCRAVGHAETKALAAARSTLDQWEVHVAAMNRLVVGMITLQQANQFWNQTRRGAARRLTRFLSAEQHLRDLETRAHCARSPGAHASKALRACTRSVAARGRALRAAERAVSTWRHHVRDMEMLRMGQMSPAMANRMWLANWHRGVVQLRRYRSAAAHAHAGHC